MGEGWGGEEGGGGGRTTRLAVAICNCMANAHTDDNVLTKIVKKKSEK